MSNSGCPLCAERADEGRRDPPKIAGPARSGALNKLEAVARLATKGWDLWEEMHRAQNEIRKSGRLMPSWPRDKFESYLDALKTDAEEALK